MSRSHESRAEAASGASRPGRGRVQTLPAPVTPLVGRAHEVEAARRRLLDGETRLLTFTGPAGIGKTRLALAVAYALLDRLAHGARFVDLASLSGPALVEVTIAQALGLQGATDRPTLVRLKPHLRYRQFVLIPDN